MQGPPPSSVKRTRTIRLCRKIFLLCGMDKRRQTKTMNSLTFGSRLIDRWEKNALRRSLLV